MRVATFRVAEHASRVIETLSDLGFTFNPSQIATSILLDTFDGRLHRAGVRLEAIDSGRLDLEMSGEGIVPAHLAVSAVPRVPGDLPRGPFRSRLEAVTDVRALTPQLRIRSRRTSGVWRDATGKVVARVELVDDVSLIDRPDLEWHASTIEIHEVPGYAKWALDALAALRELGVDECETDTVTQCAAAAGVDLAGFTSTATVPLDPEMAAIDGFRLVLANLATAIEANWQGTIEQTDPEFLHDLRIAVRRTRTILAGSKGVLPQAALGPARAEFAWLAALTGPPRDLDVSLLEWSDYLDPLPGEVRPALEPVREALERRCAVAHHELERALRSTQATDLIGAWRAWLTEPVGDDDLPRRAGEPLGRLVAKRIDRAHMVLVERGRRIGPDTPAEQVHDLRKDAKKLRYLLECFGSLLPERPRKKYVKRLKALQDNLGTHQDADVHASMMRELAHELYAAGASADTMVAIGQLVGRLDAQRLTARAEFSERFADYDTPATQHTLDAILDGIVG